MLIVQLQCGQRTFVLNGVDGESPCGVSVESPGAPRTQLVRESRVLRGVVCWHGNFGPDTPPWPLGRQGRPSHGAGRLGRLRQPEGAADPGGLRLAAVPRPAQD